MSHQERETLSTDTESESESEETTDYGAELSIFTLLRPRVGGAPTGQLYFPPLVSFDSRPCSALIPAPGQL